MIKRISFFFLIGTLLFFVTGHFCVYAKANLNEGELENEKIEFLYQEKNIIKKIGDFDNFIKVSDENDKIYVCYQLNYEVLNCEHKQSLVKFLNEEQRNLVIKEHREELKKHQKTKNEIFIKKHNLLKKITGIDVRVGEYSPFIQIIFDNMAQFHMHKGFLDSTYLSTNEIKKISVTNEIKFENNSNRTNSNTNSPLYYMEDIYDDVGIYNDDYSGEGIKIGIMEAEGITNSMQHNELNNLSLHCGNGTTINSHAAYVTRTLCGSNGIAPGVDDVYIYQTGNTGDFIGALDYFVNNGCDVINISLGVYDVTNGEYYWYDALMDYYIYNCFITIVASSGNINNEQDSNNYCDHPSMGFNVITVGSLDANNCSAYDSAYGSNPNLYTLKPTLSAPGVNVETADWKSGTSISAPIVSGIIARLMDEFPYLTSSPEVIIAALIASTTPVSGQSTYIWDTYAGAGRINYEKARQAIRNSISFYNDEYVAGDSLILDTINVDSNKTIKFAAFWMANSMVSSATSTVIRNIHTNYDLKIRDVNNNNILVQGISLNNIEYIVFDNYNLELIVELYQNANKLTSYTDYGGIAWCYV